MTWLKSLFLRLLAGGPLNEAKTYMGLVLAFLPVVLPEVPIDQVKPLLEEAMALWGPTVQLAGSFLVVWGGLHKLIKVYRVKKADE